MLCCYCCQRLSADGKYVVCEMTTGDHFCTFGILFDINSEASVVAKTYCEVLRLMKEDLDEVLSNHRALSKYAVISSRLVLELTKILNVGPTVCPEKKRSKCFFL